MHGRRVYHARGKVLGGSSSINGMIFQRGNPLDYERWGADPGMGEWDYAHCLPYFKKMERCLAGGDDYRGTDGPLVLERGPASSPLFGAFFEAVQQAGYPLTDDVNGYRQEGFARFDRNLHRGRRLSAARAYLHPVDAAGEPEGGLPGPGQPHPLRGHAGGRRRVRRARADGTLGPARAGHGRRGHLLRRRHQLAAAAPAVRRRQRRGAGRPRRPGGPRPPRRGREPPGPPRGLHPARVHPARLDVPGPALAQPAVDRLPLAVLPPGPRRHQPLRGRRLHPQQRRRGLPERHVPLPPHRRALRRQRARRRPRLPGPRRADVLRRPRVGEDHLDRPRHPPGAALQLPVDGTGPAGVGGGRAGGPDHPRPAGVRALRRR